jgi:hypothetical protein
MRPCCCVISIACCLRSRGSGACGSLSSGRPIRWRPLPRSPLPPVALRHATLLLLIEAIVRCPTEQELRYTVAPIDGDLACTLEGPAELMHLLEHELATAPEPGTAADLGNGFTAVRSAVQSGAAQIAAVGPGRLVMRWPLAR